MCYARRKNYAKNRFTYIELKQANETKKLLLDNKFYINRIVKDLGKKNRCIISTKI